MLAIPLPPEIEQRLQALADKTGTTKTDCARLAILRFIEDMEDIDLAVERLESPARRWTLDELEQGLDLER